MRQDYLAQRKKAALAGQVYKPTLGFATVNNVGGGRKYPYDPFYGGFSPRVSVAWNPKFNDGLLGKLLGENKTVIRAGYGRIFGRLNGVNLLLVPLLPPGPAAGRLLPGRQPHRPVPGQQRRRSQHRFPHRRGRHVRSAAHRLADPAAALSSRAWAATPARATSPCLDPKYRPERTDNVTVTLQRQIIKKMTLEVGYVGRIIRNELEADQPGRRSVHDHSRRPDLRQGIRRRLTSRSNAGRNASRPQPFFETALGGANSAHTAPASQTAPPPSLPRTPPRSGTPPFPICGPRCTRLRVGRWAAA